MRKKAISERPKSSAILIYWAIKTPPTDYTIHGRCLQGYSFFGEKRVQPRFLKCSIFLYSNSSSHLKNRARQDMHINSSSALPISFL